MPHARHTDPKTSHEAAQSVKDLSSTQQAILALFAIRPMHDEMLVASYRLLAHAPYASESGIRSRRSELARQGYLESKGTTKTRSGRSSIIWGLK